MKMIKSMKSFLGGKMCNKTPWNAVKCSKLEAVTREITIMVPLTSLAVTLRLNWSARQPQDQFNLELHFYTLAGTGKDIQSFIFLFISWKRKTILHDPDGVLELVKLYFSPTPPPPLTDACSWSFTSLTVWNKSLIATNPHVAHHKNGPKPFSHTVFFTTRGG